MGLRASRLRAQRRLRAARDEHIDRQAHQLLGQARSGRPGGLGGAILDGEVALFAVAGGAQPTCGCSMLAALCAGGSGFRTPTRSGRSGLRSCAQAGPDSIASVPAMNERRAIIAAV